MSDVRSSGDDLPFKMLQDNRRGSLKQASRHEAMEYGSNNFMVWPPMCWCKAGQMSILQAGTEKNQGRFFYQCPRNLRH
ncbi:hypothetical protein ACS0TY_011389 [Phlomoides rotata]